MFQPRPRGWRVGRWWLVGAIWYLLSLMLPFLLYRFSIGQCARTHRRALHQEHLSPLRLEKDSRREQSSARDRTVPHREQGWARCVPTYSSKPFLFLRAISSSIRHVGCVGGVSTSGKSDGQASGHFPRLQQRKHTTWQNINDRSRKRSSLFRQPGFRRGVQVRWPRLCRGISRCWLAGVDKIIGRNLALNAEIIYSPITSAVVALAHFADFPFPGIGQVYGVEKLLATSMSLSKLPRHFDEAIKNLPRQFDESSNSYCSAQPISIFHLDKPSEFLAFKKSHRASSSFWLGERANPRSLVSHVVLKVSAEWLGYFTTSSGNVSGTEPVQGPWRSSQCPALHSTERTCYGRLPGMPTWVTGRQGHAAWQAHLSWSKHLACTVPFKLEETVCTIGSLMLLLM